MPSRGRLRPTPPAAATCGGMVAEANGLIALSGQVTPAVTSAVISSGAGGETVETAMSTSWEVKVVVVGANVVAAVGCSAPTGAKLDCGDVEAGAGAGAGAEDAEEGLDVAAVDNVDC